MEKPTNYDFYQTAKDVSLLGRFALAAVLSKLGVNRLAEMIDINLEDIVVGYDDEERTH